MGQIRFVVSPPERITEEMVQQVYLSGIEQAPWKVRVAVENGQLVLQRAVSDSASAHVLWPIEGREALTLATGSLIEQPQPYQLPLELARGVLGRLRGQLADWQAAGVTVPAPATAKVAEAIAYFSQAAVAQDATVTSAGLAEAAIRAALDAGDLLAAAYIEQAMASRRRSGGKPAVLAGDLGGTLLDETTARQFLQTFNAAAVPVCWRQIEAAEGRFNWKLCDKQIEWCRAHGLKVCGGPLLQLDLRSLPDWLCLWEGDFDNVQLFASEFIRAAVTRYRGKVDVWLCSGRMNTAEVLGLSEEEKLRLTARAVDVVRSLDPAAATVVSFDQPWGEYMSRRDQDFPPLQLADALVRAGLELKGLMLEINLGYNPGGTLPRPPLEFSRQMDGWSMLGLPLMVSVTTPSGSEDDPLATRRVKPTPGSRTPRAQQVWIARYLPLLLAKPYVQAVIWNQLSDAEPHDFPHGGLFDRQLQPKPALKTLSLIRQTYLK